MFMYQMRKKEKWMTKMNSTSSLVMTSTPKAISYIVLIQEGLSLIKMSSSMKRDNVIIYQVLKTITFPHNLKKMAWNQEKILPYYNTVN